MIGFGIRCRREPDRLRTRILCTAADHADLGKTKFSWNLLDWTFRETTGMRPAGANLGTSSAQPYLLCVNHPHDRKPG